MSSRTDAPQPVERPLRYLFFLYHAGYLRHYAEPLRRLAREGHVIHLAFTIVEKDVGDRVLAERLAAEFESITFGDAPTRPYFDRWRRPAILVRAFTDLARYIDPRYATASALRRRMAQKIKRQITVGNADPATSFVLARLVDALAGRTSPRLGRALLRVLRAAEQAIPTSRTIDAFIGGFRPDVVLVTPLVEYASSQVDYLKSARHLGVSTAACIASWDNLTNKGLLRFTPDRVLVWNEIQRRELEELHGVPGDRAVVTGGQKFDAWFELGPSREAGELKRAAGLRPEAPYLLYVCSSPFIAPDEVSFVRRWVGSLRAADDERIRELGVLVRPHPQNAEQWEGVDLRELGNAVVWPPAGAQPDDAGSRADFFDSIHWSVAVVGVNSSAMIDAAIVGRNVLTILDPAFADTQEGTIHFHYLLRESGGFLEVARTFEEHQRQVLRALAGGDAETERVRDFVRSFVRPNGLDRPVAPIVASAFLDLARAPAPLPERPPFPILALRGVLLVPTLAGSALALPATIRRRRALRLPRRRASAVGTSSPEP